MCAFACTAQILLAKPVHQFGSGVCVQDHGTKSSLVAVLSSKAEKEPGFDMSMLNSNSFQECLENAGLCRAWVSCRHSVKCGQDGVGVQTSTGIWVRVALKDKHVNSATAMTSTSPSMAEILPWVSA